VASEHDDEDGEELAAVAAHAVELGLDWVVSVSDEEELAHVLERHDPEIFHLALERLGARPEQVLFIDDFRHNIAAAAQLGIRGHRFLTPARLRWALERHGLLRAARMSPLKGDPALDHAIGATRETSLGVRE